MGTGGMPESESGSDLIRSSSPFVPLEGRTFFLPRVEAVTGVLVGFLTGFLGVRGFGGSGSRSL